ncbi:MAG: TetR/AcrR family transcriptional regulator [Streptosporangiaceae bacterium]
MSVTDAAPVGLASLRERKKAATRHALGIAAMRLAVQHGLDSVLVEDIAAAAGVSPRTFNNYFASKYEAICALPTERGRQIGEALRARPPGEPLSDAIAHAVVGVHGLAEQPPDKAWLDGVRLVVSSPQLQGEYLRSQYATQQALAAAIAARLGTDPAADLFPAVIAGAVTAATHVAMSRWFGADPPVALAPLLRNALSVLADPRWSRAGPQAAGDPVPRPGS